MEEDSAAFQGSVQPALHIDQFGTPAGDYERSTVFSISHSGKDFYSTVDETAGQQLPIPLAAEQRSRSNTPSTISVNNLPRISSKTGFASLIPPSGDLESSLKGLALTDESDVSSAIRLTIRMVAWLIDLISAFGQAIHQAINRRHTHCSQINVHITYCGSLELHCTY